MSILHFCNINIYVNRTEPNRTELNYSSTSQTRIIGLWDHEEKREDKCNRISFYRRKLTGKKEESKEEVLCHMAFMSF